MKTHFHRIQPSTVQDAIELLHSWMDENDKLEFIMEGQSGRLHHGFMRHVRNEWNLWDTSTPIVRNTKAVYGVDHADDISGLIEGGLLAKLNGDEFNFDAEARRYKDHWAREAASKVKAVPIEPYAFANNTGRADHLVPNPTARPGTLEAPRKRGILDRLFSHFSQ
ncbi:hypothetical protein HOU03_gp399 [Caulobacter phage CcrSC]|uniref:DUF6794 domain-containing protein n=1 Tax=Caulobacter phage CcrSC TaxID=2283272 RepID=A0A385EGH3_9CAUD|nr:hypothetical protein HOU03_gp399 [Caulobacter phage CcrSC]AXQ69869.1 hypothetical protein CcrSC_gp287 [Caulobacter phage CcrSC]